MYYSGSETLNIGASDVITAAEFDWKQAAVAVQASGLEIDVQNTGKEMVIDLLEARIKNAERTMKNNITSGLYSDGTGTGGKQIGGLQLLVADDPTTGTVGGINRATYSFGAIRLRMLRSNPSRYRQRPFRSFSTSCTCVPRAARIIPI